jgi:anti-sigma regulatory factor (Ser/Thr protein kinase)
MFYAGEREFLDGTVPFIREGVAAGESVLVVVSAEKIELLRAHLNGEAEHVRFADMAEIGANPARIIPAWGEFVEAGVAAGRALRGIGEPIFSEREPAELIECHRHESLLNVAFADAPSFWLMCPYDTTALDPDVLDEAQRTHPYIAEGPVRWASARYAGLDAAAAPFAEPLPDPPEQPLELPFGQGDLPALRRTIRELGTGYGMTPLPVNDLIVAVNEVATNSLRHGGGEGLLRVWEDDGMLVTEVRDSGRIEAPLIGRERPTGHSQGGYGLWMVNQICDLVQVRSFRSGSAVRMHMRIA